ncbi:septum formation initiator [Micromonospora sp. WMMD1076]|uniref:septum formation initiator n=1 Tax=Micromonospora sp. WMMD1076 TaxID=3016103 RepID=UPI00249B88D4|nr:septum formation initiator [Micromonospora sp. WMMD1076]WFF04566.1 septum formation initiator [Micromonospora sp. WMMD1076]
MPRRSLLVVAGWLATATVATLIGMGAIRMVGDSITGTPGGVRSEDEIARDLEADPVPPPSPPSTPAPTAAVPPATGSAPTMTPTSTGTRRSFTTAGGSAVAECTPQGIRLVSWAPAQGFRVRDVDRGPDDDVEVRFEGAAGAYELKVRCLGDEPVSEPDD